MPWRKIVGILLFIVALVIGTVTFILPGVSSHATTLSISDKISGVIQVETPKRGWTGDWMPVTVDIATTDSTHTDSLLTFRAKLEMSGVDSQPEGNISRVITSGEEANFSWKFRTAQKGDSRGMLWVFVKEQESEETLLFAREFTFQSTNFGPLAPKPARALGVISVLVGILLFNFPRIFITFKHFFSE